MILIMAWRNIWRNKMRSLVIMLSVILGLFAGIMVLAIYKGMMHDRIRNVIEHEVGDIQLHHPNFKKDYDPQFVIENSETVLSKLNQLDNISFIAKRTITQGMLSNTTGGAGVQINGINFEKEKMVSGINKNIKEGRAFDSLKKNEIIIGWKLAKKMKLKLGNKLVLTFTDTNANIVSGAFRICGIYESNNAPLDERNVYVQMNELNVMLGIGEKFHEIVVLIKQEEQLEQTEKYLKTNLSNILVETWKTISPETELMIVTVDAMSYIIIGIILFALAFGIVNAMLMAILERNNEIGMMMALGMNKIKLFKLVLLETIFLTVAGAPIGLFISWIVCKYFQVHGINWANMGKEMMSSFGFDVMIYPIFPTEKVITIVCFVFATAFLSCLYPAIKALSLKPVEALRK